MQIMNRGYELYCCMEKRFGGTFCFSINKELAEKIIEFIDSYETIYSIGHDNVTYGDNDNIKLLLNKSPSKKNIEINVIWEIKEFHRYYDFISVKKFKKKLNEIIN